MIYLLDTNVVAAIINRNHRVAECMRGQGVGDIVLSSVVLYELYFGAAKSGRAAHNRAMIDGLSLPVLPFEVSDALAAGALRHQLQRLGTPIGPYDTMIAGHALARGLILVTHNTRQFSRVPGLRIEDWEA